MDLSVYHASTPNPRSAGPTPQSRSVGRQALADTLNTSGILALSLIDLQYYIAHRYNVVNSEI